MPTPKQVDAFLARYVAVQPDTAPVDRYVVAWSQEPTEAADAFAVICYRICDRLRAERATVVPRMASDGVGMDTGPGRAIVEGLRHAHTALEHMMFKSYGVFLQDVDAHRRRSPMERGGDLFGLLSTYLHVFGVRRGD
jgi:hypothetical protein